MKRNDPERQEEVGAWRKEVLKPRADSLARLGRHATGIGKKGGRSIVREGETPL